MPDIRKTIPLRLPKELADELARWAADDLRSLNGQIEFLLREALRKQRRRDIEEPPDAAEGETV